MTQIFGSVCTTVAQGKEVSQMFVEWKPSNTTGPVGDTQILSGIVGVNVAPRLLHN